MPRKAKNTFELPDGRKVMGSLQQRGEVWRILFSDPDRPGKYKEATTRKRTEREAWPEAAKIILAAYNPEAKPDPRKATWEQVIKELPTVGEFRERGLEAYTSRLNVLREIIPNTRGPRDITLDVAKRFRQLYSTSTFKKSKKEGAKEYKRSPVTVATTLRLLSCLWNHLISMGLAETNPWQSVPRPDAPKIRPIAPTEADIDQFFAWVDSKGWELLSVFLRVKALAGCRTNDLCQVLSSQFDPKTRTLTITSDQDKTKRERRIPLPADLAKRLSKIQGKTYLWERYATDSKTFRPGRRNQSEFRPSLMYWFIDDIFPQYRKAFPDRPHIMAHDLRRRAITLMVEATQSVDATAEALGVHPETARKHYLDAQQAYNSTELFKKMADVLVPK
ncbi:MAG TPA: site-specific integrase [Gemmata sp.]|nr:site-specific integrase [Gemmata sp.]